jgi:hypothetical protein
MKILWVKADKLLPIDNGGNIRMDHSLWYRVAVGDGGPGLAGDGRSVQRSFALGSEETVFCGEPGSGAHGMKKKRGLCGHRR